MADTPKIELRTDKQLLATWPPEHGLRHRRARRRVRRALPGSRRRQAGPEGRDRRRVPDLPGAAGGLAGGLAVGGEVARLALLGEDSDPVLARPAGAGA